MRTMSAGPGIRHADRSVSVNSGVPVAFHGCRTCLPRDGQVQRGEEGRRAEPATPAESSGTDAP
jgi:hypothetical protein